MTKKHLRMFSQAQAQAMKIITEERLRRAKQATKQAEMRTATTNLNLLESKRRNETHKIIAL